MIGLAVGIGAVVLLAVLSVVVVFRIRNRARCDAYEDGGVQPGLANSSFPVSSVLPDVLASSTQFRSRTDVSYEEVDLPSQGELNNDSLHLYSMAGNFETLKPSDNNEYKDVHWKKKTNDAEAVQLAVEKNNLPETYPSDSTYSVLSKPTVKPTISAAANTPDNYSTLYDMNLKPINESPNNLQPGQTGYGYPHGNDYVEYDTTYSAVRQSKDDFVKQSNNEQQDGGEYDELKVQKV